MADYITVEELASFLGHVQTGAESARLDIAIDAAERAIEAHTGRIFNLVDADTTATARVFWPCSYWRVPVDDIGSLTDLAVKTDDDDDGTFETTLNAADYTALPYNNTGTGKPYNEVRLFPTASFRMFGWHPPVQVTAKWGWPEVPAAVKQATLILAGNLWKRKDSPFGVAGFAEFGVLRIRDDPDVVSLLAPYINYRMAGIA